MTGLWKPDREYLGEYLKGLEEDIADSEWDIRNATGRRSKQRFEETYEGFPALSKKAYQEFTNNWPCMNDLPELKRPLYQECEDPEMDIFRIMARLRNSGRYP